MSDLESIEEGWRLMEQSPASARERAETIVARTTDRAVTLRGRVLIGTCLTTEGDVAAGIGTLLSAVFELRDGSDDQNLGRAYNALGNAYRHIGNVKDNLHFLRASLELRRRSGNAVEQALGLQNLAIGLSVLGDHVGALVYLDEAASLSADAGHPAAEGTALLNASHSHIELGNYPAALEATLRGVELLGDKAAPIRLAFAHQQLCTAARLAGRYDISETAGRRALELAASVERPKANWSCLMAMGRLFLDRGWHGADPDRGLQMLNAALEEAERLQSQPSLVEMRKILAEACEAEGLFQEALEHHRALHELQRSIYQQNAAGQLAALKAQLKVQSLSRHAAELAALNSELERANRAKSEFLEIASHDLKNAMSAVLMTATLIQEESVTQARIRPGIVIERQTRRMLRLIDNLLDSDAIESGERSMRPEVFDLAELASEVADGFSASAAKKDIRIDLHSRGRCPVYADRSAAGQVIENLVSNAVKFSPKRGHVAIDVTDHQLSVGDSGPGFSLRDHQTMYQRFARLSATPTGDEPSTGLGLSIVHNLMQAIDGQITAENGPRGGALMTILLPAPPKE